MSEHILTEDVRLLYLNCQVRFAPDGSRSENKKNNSGPCFIVHVSFEGTGNYGECGLKNIFFNLEQSNFFSAALKMLKCNTLSSKLAKTHKIAFIIKIKFNSTIYFGFTICRPTLWRRRFFVLQLGCKVDPINLQIPNSLFWTTNRPCTDWQFALATTIYLVKSVPNYQLTVNLLFICYIVCYYNLIDNNCRPLLLSCKAPMKCLCDHFASTKLQFMGTSWSGPRLNRFLFCRNIVGGCYFP